MASAQWLLAVWVAMKRPASKHSTKGVGLELLPDSQATHFCPLERASDMGCGHFLHDPGQGMSSLVSWLRSAMSDLPSSEGYCELEMG